MMPISRDLARIFRVTHIDNLPWMLDHGIHCRSSATHDPNFRNIGSADLIAKRTAREVPIAPGGTLSDYVPFYFTSRSPMLFNIKTGWRVPAVPMRDIVVLVSSLPRLAAEQLSFVYSDRHAYLLTAQFSSELDDLDRIDWDILQRSDFAYDSKDPGKMERYQAEALVHRHLPLASLDEFVCCDDRRRDELKELMAPAGIDIVTRREFFF